MKIRFADYREVSGIQVMGKNDKPHVLNPCSMTEAPVYSNLFLLRLVKVNSINKSGVIIREMSSKDNS